MKLPRPGLQYDPGNEAQTRAAIEQADGQNVKTYGQGIIQKLKFKDTVTGAIHTVTVASGVLTVT